MAKFRIQTDRAEFYWRLIGTKTELEGAGHQVRSSGVGL